MRRETLRSIALCLFGFAALPVLAKADGAPATQPAAPAEEFKVIVFPFASIDPTQSNGWIGKAIEQSLLTEIARVPHARGAGATEPAGDPTAATAAAQKIDARYGVYGSVQSIGSDLRLTGFVVDARSGRALASLKSTGRIDDLFEMEDTVAHQVQRALATAEPATVAASFSPQLSPGSKVISIEPSGALRTSYLPPAAEPQAEVDRSLKQYYQAPSANDAFPQKYNQYKSNPGSDWNGYYFGGYYAPFGYGYGSWGGRWGGRWGGGYIGRPVGPASGIGHVGGYSGPMAGSG